MTEPTLDEILEKLMRKIEEDDISHWIEVRDELLHCNLSREDRLKLLERLYQMLVNEDCDVFGCFNRSQLESQINEIYLQRVVQKYDEGKKAEAGIIIGRLAEKDMNIIPPGRRGLNIYFESISAAMKEKSDQVGVLFAYQLTHCSASDSLLLVEKFKNALQQDPESIHSNLGIARCYYAMHQIEKADEYYMKAVELGSEDAKVEFDEIRNRRRYCLSNFGILQVEFHGQDYLELGRLAEAEEEFKKEIEKYPDRSCSPYYLLMEIYILQGREEEYERIAKMSREAKIPKRPVNKALQEEIRAIRQKGEK